MDSARENNRGCQILHLQGVRKMLLNIDRVYRRPESQASTSHKNNPMWLVWGLTSLGHPA